ncbi:hypothetical protein SPSYN_00274 [Sporotomaculum syntrophicum]|uniref:Type 4 fimbrial biogenesis protein PilX N-terminal domain-containing protein n=1 Tax=Sporotomaculum syntrophicum TaxID=182264 RepID=A0A9D2WSZ2_9FIRM|nr:DUF342 domain-containing protein [Sporotomaculum syntrophicum]KAF1086555.1 hypothetical protein SPSYN_00274 [Sporotomaculum syntrophicum]
MKKTLGEEDGQTLVLVIMITAVLFILSSALCTMTIGCYMNVIREEEYIKAHCAAEAGVEKTIAAIKEDDGWLNNLPAANSNDVFTRVFLETPVSDDVTNSVEAIKQRQFIGNSLLINSFGRYENDAGELLAQKTLRYTVAVYGMEDFLKGLAVLPAQPASFDMYNNITVDGSMIINGSINIPDNMLVNGDIYASGNVTGNCVGQIHSNYDYIPSFPELDENYYLEKATEDDHVFYNDVEFGGCGVITDYNGFYYVEGNVNVSGDYQGIALIFSTGNINVMGNMETGVSGGENTGIGNGSLTLVALGDINIHSFNVYANVIAGGSLYAQEGASLYGAACVGDLIYEPVGVGLLKICHVLGPEPLDGALTVNIKTKLWEESRAVF